MTDHEKGNETNASEIQSSPRERPTALKGSYYRPVTQVVMLGIVCLMCSGLYNALNGLGAGGQVDSATSANANATLYATFAFAAFFAGSVNNMLGARLTLLLGSLGYALSMGSYLAMSIHPNAGGFVIAAGAILGICAALLWTAQGSLMLAYPTEGQKGRFISIFWAIYSLGGVVGAAVPLGTNFHSKTNSVEIGTYIGFLVLTLIGVLLPLLMVNPSKMIRTDGIRVKILQRPSWKSGFIGLAITIKRDPLIIMLFPMFFASNWFYPWQFNDYNGALFNIRGRSLNNFIYWLSQMVGSWLMGAILDRKNVRRRVRAFIGWTILFAMVWGVHIWAYFYQKGYTRESVPPEAEKMDIFDPPFIGRIFLYAFCGILNATWQITSYWIMGAMSNDAAKLAYFTGLYKSIQSAGSAGVWRADAVKLPFMNIFISTWVLLVVGLLFALPMIHWRVTDHTDSADGNRSPPEPEKT